MMETVRMMWGMSKGLTIGTFVTLALMLGLVGFLWWIPVTFGYPWYSLLWNLVPTAVLGVGVYMVRGVIRS